MPDPFTRFTVDGFVHEIVTIKNTDPVLTVAGYYRTTLKCGQTCDCAEEELVPGLRFALGPTPTVDCPGCLA